MLLITSNKFPDGKHFGVYFQSSFNLCLKVGAFSTKSAIPYYISTISTTSHFLIFLFNNSNVFYLCCKTKYMHKCFCVFVNSSRVYLFIQLFFG